MVYLPMSAITPVVSGTLGSTFTLCFAVAQPDINTITAR
jgi:hypothetical protein